MTNNTEYTKVFRPVIGYESIKQDLYMILDMIQNPDAYRELAVFPRGILLYGEPGMGKTLMSKCFIKAAGLPSYVIEKKADGNAFLSQISETFVKAGNEAPAVVILEDFDKWCEEDSEQEEYTALQAALDSVKHTVIVFGTANSIENFPPSLLSRFDYQREVELPSPEDTKKIVNFYLSGKKVVKKIPDDFYKMLTYRGCARLESIINRAGLHAGYRRSVKIEMQDLVWAVLKDNGIEISSCYEEDRSRRIAALHEAGHVLVAEYLNVDSFGFAAVYKTSGENVQGITRYCKQSKRSDERIMITLAGKAAVDLYYSDADVLETGCGDDLHKAVTLIREQIEFNGYNGLSGLMKNHYPESVNHTNYVDAVITAELERYMKRTTSILQKSRGMLERVTDKLYEKGILLASDLRKAETEGAYDDWDEEDSRLPFN